VSEMETARSRGVESAGLAVDLTPADQTRRRTVAGDRRRSRGCTAARRSRSGM